MPKSSLRQLVAVAALLASAAGAAFAAPTPSANAIHQMDAIRSIKTNKSAVQNKIDSRLYLGLLHSRGDARLAPLTDFRFVRPEGDGRVPVELILANRAGVKAATNTILGLGGTVLSHSYDGRRISARVHLADLDALSAMTSVKKIRQAMPRMTNVINVSEGDATHGADESRGFFGINGSGVKICAISDGVDSLASLQASGDLPPGIDVLDAGAGDEGSAMLEIIHDLAPGAALGFAQAGPDEASFAANIVALGTAPHNCNIIVDDIIYLDESPFEDGPVAQAVNTVTGLGVLYFSSAGNEGNSDDLTAGTWEGDFLASAAADPAPLAGANLHDFGDGGNSILVEFGGGNPPLLIWAEHYDLATGLASTDFDIYDMDGGLTTIFDASTDVQDGVGGDDFPIEFIGGGTFGGERLLIDKFAAGATSSVPMFNLIVFRGELDDALVTGGATRGHSASSAAFSVAATPAGPSFDGVTPDGPFPGLFTAANASESFTSDGPRRIILSPTGVEITPGNRTSTGGVVRQKPDITAADGVSTAAPGFNPFYGTSAAAPHAAAIAALCKSGNPAITPAALRTALTSTAIDIEALGVDSDTGAGIVMAHPFLVACGVTPQAFLDDGTWTKAVVTGDADAFVEVNETWSLQIPLTNIGGVGATAISAVLSSSTPGITFPNANSTYPDLAVAASANNNTLYRFKVGAAASCGVPIDFTLTVTYTGGPSPQAFNFSIATGSPGAPTTFSYAGPVVPIADSGGSNVAGPTAIATLPVVSPVSLYSLSASIDGTVCDANVGTTTVGIDHTFANDLQIDLKSPAGTQVTIINRTDGGGNNFCQTVLDDANPTSIQTAATANAPFTGPWAPANELAAFTGEAVGGTWELHATDFFVGDIGNIRAWSITAVPALCNAPLALEPANLTGTKTASGTFAPGSTVTYTVTITNNGVGAQPDNATDEFTDVLPSSLTLVSASATSGTAVATIGTNTVTWNGALAVAGSVTITIQATVNNVPGGTIITNQGTTHSDDGTGSNTFAQSTDDPGTPAAGDGTSFAVVAPAVPVTEVPTLSEWSLALLAFALAVAGLSVRRRRA